MDTPVGEKWWPNKLWGAGDEAGATNWYTKPDIIQRAVAEAKTGKVYRLGRPYTSNQPAFAARQFVMRIVGTPTGGPFGANMVVYHDEFVATEIGQTGTQFDGLGHIGVAINGPGDHNEMRFYNGYSETEIGDTYGLKKLGAEKLHPIVARGILLDIAGLEGVEAMEAGQEITMTDVRAALKRQGMEDFTFMPGDVVLFRTGWVSTGFRTMRNTTAAHPASAWRSPSGYPMTCRPGSQVRTRGPSKLSRTRTRRVRSARTPTSSRATVSCFRTWILTAPRATRSTRSCTCSAQCRSPEPLAPQARRSRSSEKERAIPRGENYRTK